MSFSLDPRNRCPYLGIETDGETWHSFPTIGNFCHRSRSPQPVAEYYQANICLTTDHVNCPVYQHQGTWRGPLPRELPVATEPAETFEDTVSEFDMADTVPVESLADAEELAEDHSEAVLEVEEEDTAADLDDPPASDPSPVEIDEPEEHEDVAPIQEDDSAEMREADLVHEASEEPHDGFMQRSIEIELPSIFGRRSPSTPPSDINLEARPTIARHRSSAAPLVILGLVLLAGLTLVVLLVLTPFQLPLPGFRPTATSETQPTVTLVATEAPAAAEPTDEEEDTSPTPPESPSPTAEAASTPAEPTPATLDGPTTATLLFDSNLRAGPGSDAVVVNFLSAETELEVMGRDVPGNWLWVRVTSTDLEGWIALTQVAGNFEIAQIPIAPDIPPTVTPSEEVPTEEPALDETPTEEPTPSS